MNGFEKAQSIAASLPKGVRSFALDENYWDPRSQLCPHDAWVQEIAVREIMAKPVSNYSSDFEEVIGRQNRMLAISLQLLGWSHENILTFSYERVSRYSLAISHLSTGGNRAHGDWLEDTIGLGKAGGVVHEIRFSSGAEWLIECSDISFVTNSVRSD